MNLKKLGRTFGIAATVAVLAMVLQGCGGDDNGSNITQDMYNTLQAEATEAKAAATKAEAEAAEAKAAEAEAKAAEAEAKADAMAAKAAEMAAKEAETAAKTAEAEAIAEVATANAAKMMAEAAEAEAKADAMAAKAAEAAAMAAQTKAETAQAIAEAAAEAAKEAAMEAKAARTAAEAAEAEAKAEMMVAKAAEEDAKEAAMEAKTAREAAETAEAEAVAKAEAAEEARKLAQADADKYKEMYEDAIKVPSTGTQEGAEGRAAARRISNAVTRTVATANTPSVVTGIAGGVTIGSLAQSAFGTPADLTLQLASGAVLSSATDTAAKAAPAIAGWTGSALEKDGPGAFTQHALVYSDIEPSVVTFGQQFPYNLTQNNATPSGGNTATHVSIAALPGTAANVPANVTLVHGLTTTTVTTRALSQNTAAPGTALTANSFIRGTFAGVPGQFVCADSNGCTISLTPTGQLQWVGNSGSGNMLFRADDLSDLLPDADYLAFGVWTEVPDSPTYANPGQTRAVAMGSAAAFNSGAINTLQGSASYSGPAAGHYAVRAASDHMVTHGRFTATATINANFDGTGAVGNAVDAVTTGDNLWGVTWSAVPPGVTFTNSSISNFMDEDGNAMPGWLVNLGTPTGINNITTVGETIAATSAAAAVAAARGSILTGGTTGTTGSQAWSGVWDASFHGVNTNTTPTGIVGRFQAEAGTPRPVTTPEGLIDQYRDTGFSGVVGGFAGR